MTLSRRTAGTGEIDDRDRRRRAVARGLQAEGIDFLFGLPSPEVDPSLAQLESHGIRQVPVRHEAAGAHMAEGLYNTTGKVAAVLGNPGAGRRTCRRAWSPPARWRAGARHHLTTPQGVVCPSPPSTFQGQDQLDLFRPAVKWGGPAFEWGRIPEVLRLAFHELRNGRPGPVHVELPAPVLYATEDDESAPVTLPTSYRGTTPQASDAQLADAVELPASAQ